ncbi:MAG: hypothetical protein MZW92_49320 [Comamonadaceae bacterium]|nr:hypothetical protein [Comamonadaceae bacterium]
MRRRILIIEDERDLAELLAFNLQQAGFATTQAHDGASGLSRGAHPSSRPGHPRPDAPRPARHRGLPPAAPGAGDGRRAGADADGPRRGE